MSVESPLHTNRARRRARALALLIVSGVAAAPERSYAQGQDEAGARALFLEGRKLARDGRYEEACPKFEAARRLYVSSGLLLNLADCHEHLNRLASAWAEFGDAAFAAQSAGRSADEAEAKRRQAALEPRIPRLVLRVVAPAADEVVRRDGVALERGAWGSPIPVDAGEHTVQAEAPGRLPRTVTVTVEAPGQTVTVDIPELKTAEPAAAVARTEPAPVLAPPSAEQSSSPPQTGLGPLRATAIAAGGLAVAGIAVGTAFGLESKAKHSQAADVCPTSQALCVDPRGAGLWHDAVVDGNVATVAFAVGGAALAAGIVLWFVGAPVHATGSAQGARVALPSSIAIGVGPGAVDVHGTW